MVDANAGRDIALGVDGIRISPHVGRRSRFWMWSVGGCVPESLVFKSQLTAVRMVIDHGRLTRWTIDSVIQLGIGETLLRRLRQTHRVGRMFFRVVNTVRTIVFHRRFELRFGDGVDTASITGGGGHQRLPPSAGRIQEPGTRSQRVKGADGTNRSSDGIPSLKPLFCTVLGFAGPKSYAQDNQEESSCWGTQKGNCQGIVRPSKRIQNYMRIFKQNQRIKQQFKK